MSSEVEDSEMWEYYMKKLLAISCAKLVIVSNDVSMKLLAARIKYDIFRFIVYMKNPWKLRDSHSSSTSCILEFTFKFSTGSWNVRDEAQISV